MPKYDQRTLPIDSIEPNAWNPQGQDEEIFEQLVEDIQKVGFIDSLTVIELSDGTFRLLGGEHRWLAARKAGLTEVPALVLDEAEWDEDAQKFETVRLNVLKGKLTPEKFISLYNEMCGKYGKDAMHKRFGFTRKQKMDALLKHVRKNVKNNLPPDKQEEFDRKAKNARTMGELEEVVHELFQRHGDTVPVSYMVFSYGKAEHIYVSMTQEMRKQMLRVLEYVERTDADINEVLAPLVELWADEAEKHLAQLPLKSKPAAKAEDPIAF